MCVAWANRLQVARSLRSSVFRWSEWPFVWTRSHLNSKIGFGRAKSGGIRIDLRKSSVDIQNVPAAYNPHQPSGRRSGPVVPREESASRQLATQFPQPIHRRACVSNRNAPDQVERTTVAPSESSSVAHELLYAWLPPEDRIRSISTLVSNRKTFDTSRFEYGPALRVATLALTGT